MKHPLFHAHLVVILLFFSVPRFFAQVNPKQHEVITQVFKRIDSLGKIEEKIAELQTQATYVHELAPFSKIFLDSAMQLAIDNNLSGEVVLGYLNYMQFFVAHAAFDSADWYFERGMKHEESQLDFILKSDFLAQKATMMRKQGDIRGAIQYFLDALEVLELNKVPEDSDEEIIIGHQRSKCILHNNLANLYNSVEDYVIAADHYDQAFALLISMEELALAGTVLMNKGSIFLERGIYDSAYQIQIEAKQLKVEGEGGQRALAMSDLNIGNALAGLNRLEEAEDYLQNAVLVFEDIDNQIGRTYAYVDLGRIKLLKGDYGEAHRLCDRGQKLAAESELIDYNQKACDCLFQTLKTVGDYRQALHFHERLKILSDSVRNEENIRHITQLEMQYQFDRVEEKRLVEEQATALLRAERQKRQRIAMIILTVLLLFAIIVAYLVYRNFQIKKKSEAVLAEKNSVISRALREKDILLREIHHRVKNNLQVISSLLRLQSRYIDDVSALDAISAGRNRVRSMALLHENLYQEDNLTGVDMAEYFDKLIDGIFHTLNISDEHISLVKEIDPIHLDIDSVVPLGLITNELITNALKHAFSEQQQGILKIKLTEQDEKLILEISDNGKGMPVDMLQNNGRSFGHKLIQSFTKKLEADLEVESENGTTVRLVINDFRKAA